LFGGKYAGVMSADGDSASVSEPIYREEAAALPTADDRELCVSGGRPCA
jgi:hypothetical protein